VVEWQQWFVNEMTLPFLFRRKDRAAVSLRHETHAARLKSEYRNTGTVSRRPHTLLQVAYNSFSMIVYDALIVKLCVKNNCESLCYWAIR